MTGGMQGVAPQGGMNASDVTQEKGRGATVW